MENNKLTKEELKEFVGGMYQLIEVAREDINNLNQTDGCWCLYKNVSAISNTNEATACACYCGL